MTSSTDGQKTENAQELFALVNQLIAKAKVKRHLFALERWNLEYPERHADREARKPKPPKIDGR